MGMLPKRTLLLTWNSSNFDFFKFASENYAESRKDLEFVSFSFLPNDSRHGSLFLKGVWGGEVSLFKFPPPPRWATFRSPWNFLMFLIFYFLAKATEVVWKKKHNEISLYFFLAKAAEVVEKIFFFFHLSSFFFFFPSSFFFFFLLSSFYQMTPVMVPYF